MFENRVLRRIFGPKRDEVRGDWGKQHNEELHNLYMYSSSNIIRMIKSRRMRWAGHVARMGKKRNAAGKKTAGEDSVCDWKTYECSQCSVPRIVKNCNCLCVL
jgi:hypothetical protein